MEKDKKTLFVVLPEKMYVSDVLHTPYIKELAEKYRVHVFIQIMKPTDPFDANAYFAHPNVTYHSIVRPAGRFWTLFDWLLRLECIRRYEDNTAVAWRNNNARERDRRRRMLHTIMRFFPKRMFSTDFFSWIEQYVMPNTKWFESFIDQYAPDLIMTSSPGFTPTEAYAIACARRKKVPTVAFNFSWDNLTSLPRHLRRTDYLICWNEFHRTAAKELHDYPDNRIFVSGTIRFDHYFRTLPGEVDREAFLSEHGLDSKRKTVLYASRAYGTFHTDFIRSFIRWQNEGAFNEPLNLFVRLHPLDDLADFEEFQGVPNVYIGLAGTKVPGALKGKGSVETKHADWIVKKDSIRHTDICVNLASTFTLEAFVFDKPVINIGFVKPFSSILTFPHYAPIVQSGAPRVAQKMDDILNYINAYLLDPSLEREERKRTTEYFVAPTDGYSYKRNIDFLNEIIRRECA